MTDTLIPISLIGNYLYCPYSIYLHNVYVESDEKGGDSVIIFDASAVKLKKYGNAIHRDTDIVYF